MAKNLNSSPSFIGTPLPSLRHGFLHSHRRLVSTRVKLNFHENLPPINSFDSHIDFFAILTKTEGLLYTLADVAIATAKDAAVQKKQWLVRVHIRRHGGRSQGNEGWTNSWARAIRVQICDNITSSISIDKATGCFPTLATIPVWMGLYQALSNVANEELLTEGFFWIPSLGDPTSIAARPSGSGISWLFPYVVNCCILG